MLTSLSIPTLGIKVSAGDTGAGAIGDEVAGILVPNLQFLSHEMTTAAKALFCGSLAFDISYLRYKSNTRHEKRAMARLQGNREILVDTIGV